MAVFATLMLAIGFFFFSFRSFGITDSEYKGKMNDEDETNVQGWVCFILALIFMAFTIGFFWNAESCVYVSSIPREAIDGALAAMDAAAAQAEASRSAELEEAVQAIAEAAESAAE